MALGPVITAERDQPHALAVCRRVLQAAAIGEERSQVEKEIEGLKAQGSAASRRVGIVRDEAATDAPDDAKPGGMHQLDDLIG
jgi:hypothetical protein